MAGRPRINFSSDEKAVRRAANLRAHQQKYREEQRRAGKRLAAAYFPPREIAVLTKMGNGNLSEGLRVAVSIAAAGDK